MTDSFKIPLALRSDTQKLVRPGDDLPEGLTFLCPACTEPLIHRKGEILRPHFAHKPGEAELVAEKLQRVEALLAGAATDGEREAAAAAKERIEARLRQAKSPCSEGVALIEIAKRMLREVIGMWLAGDCPAPEIQLRCAGRCSSGKFSFPVSSACETLIEAKNKNLVLLNSWFAAELEIDLREGRISPGQQTQIVVLDPGQVIDEPLVWRAAALFGFSVTPLCKDCEAAGIGQERRVPNPLIESVPSTIFGPNGALVKMGREHREGQLAMAQAVDNALQKSAHLLVEGPCGTGKSLAYLAPAVAHGITTGRKVVVATSNIALQAQLLEKDLPFLQKEVFKAHFTFALLKGRNNYLCPLRYEEWREAVGEDADRDQLKFMSWATGTKTGDQRELGYRPKFWGDVCGLTDTCTDCKETAGCFYQKSKEAANSADVIVTNHTMLFAHLAVKRAAGRGTVLPPFRILICDEGHELADQARGFFGFELTEGNLASISKSFSDLGAHLKPRALQMSYTAREFFAKVRSTNRHIVSQWINGTAKEETEELLEHLAALSDALATEIDDLELDLENVLSGQASRRDRGERKKIEKALRQAQRRHSRARNAYDWISKAALGTPDPYTGSPYAIWHETDRKFDTSVTRLCGRPVSVSEYLKEEVFAAHDSVIVTSATLTTDNSFDYISNEIGFDGETLAVSSPFDFARQGRLVFPTQAEMPVFPTQGDKEKFHFHAARCIDAAVSYSNGAALCLFTSFKSMNAVRALLRTRHRILVQGDASREKLVRDFAEDKSSVLLGVDSFWTGVDVPGDALTMLVIEKMPFVTPDDPLMAYWEKHYAGQYGPSKAGKEVFTRYSVPQALIKLRQGAGRLIRSRTDYGVILVLDRRILTKGYGKQALNSLPFTRHEQGLSAIKNFYEQRQNTGPVAQRSARGAHNPRVPGSNPGGPIFTRAT